MAYAVKYLFKFQSSNGIVREIRVLQDGYSGDVIQRPLGRAPVIKKEQNGGVHGTSLTFYAECHIDQEYIEFYTSDPKEYRVDVYAGSTLLWQGYITPELYSEPDIAPPYDVQVVATDGVGELKLYDFTPQGTVTLRSLLAYLLGHTGLSTDVNLISSLKPGSHGAGALLDMQICIDYFAGKDCYEALTYILDTLHATITRWGGAWLLVRETNVTFTNDKVRYFNTSGNSALLAGSVQTLGAMRSAPAWPVGQLSTVIDPAKNKVVVQAPWHPVSGLVNSGMTSDTGWTKAGGAAYDATNVGYHFPAASLSALPRISQEIVMSGLRMPFRMSGRFTGVSADLSLGTLFTAGIGFYVTYTTNSATYHLERSDEGIVWKQGAMPGLLGFDDTLSTFLQNFDEDRTAGREIGFTVPPFVQGSAFPAGTLKIYIIGNCARIYAATLDVEVSKGYQDILRIDNGARGEGDEVEIAIGRQIADVAYYQSFLQGLLLDSGSLITGFTDANFTTAMDYLALISRDYALSAALPRALAKGTVYLESSIGMPPLVFAKGGLNYWLETWSWDLYEDELEISARTLPSASLTVQSETILESNGSMVSSGASGGSSGGSIDGGAGVNYFQINSDRAELVELKSQYSYLGPKKGLIFDVNSSEDAIADLEVVTKTIDGTPRRVLHSRLPFYTDGFLSGGGLSTTGGGGGGIDPAAMWALLAASTSEQINSSHITFPVTSVVGQTGNITASQIATAIGLSGYLPLSAGSDKTLTGTLYSQGIVNLGASTVGIRTRGLEGANTDGTQGNLFINQNHAGNVYINGGANMGVVSIGDSSYTGTAKLYVTGGGADILTLNRAYGGAYTWIDFHVGGTHKGYVGFGSDGKPYVNTDAAHEIYHTGNLSPLTTSNYTSYALPRSGGSSYPMTGAIYVPSGSAAIFINGAASAAFFGTADESTTIGQNYGTTNIRSGNTDLVHTKITTDYIIYDQSNFRAGTEYVSISGTETITGTKTFSNSVLGAAIEVKRNDANYASVIKFSNVTDGVLGYLGFGGSIDTAGVRPIYYTGANTYTLYHSGNSNKSDVPWTAQRVTVGEAAQTTYSLKVSGSAFFTSGDSGAFVIHRAASGASILDFAGNNQTANVWRIAGTNPASGAFKIIDRRGMTENERLVIDSAGTVSVGSLKLSAGSPTLTWDTTNSAWHLSGSLYVDGFLSGGGLSTTGGGGGIDPTAMWNLLAAPTSEPINSSHITFPVTSVVNQTGNVTATQIATAIGLGNYLPLTGGTLTGSGREVLRITTTATNPTGAFIRFTAPNTNDGLIGVYNDPDNEFLFLGIGSRRLILNYATTDAYIGTDSTRYAIYHQGNFTPGDYLSRSGGTMTGAITVPNGSSALTVNGGSSALMFGVADAGSYFGQTAGTTVLRSGDTSLLHRKNGNDYVIYDASNLTQSVITTLIGSSQYAPYYANGYVKKDGDLMTGGLAFQNGSTTDSYAPRIERSSTAFAISSAYNGGRIPFVLGWRNISTPAIYMSDAGYVGINTSTPSHYFEVDGSTYLSSAGFGLTLEVHRHQSNGNSVIKFSNLTSTAYNLLGYVGIDSSGKFYFSPTGTSSDSYFVRHTGNFVAGTDYVSISGTETIKGAKTFTGAILAVKYDNPRIGFYAADGTLNGIYAFRTAGTPEIYHPTNGWKTIYHSGNSNLSTVAWACSTLTASGPSSGWAATMTGGTASKVYAAHTNGTGLSVLTTATSNAIGALQVLVGQSALDTGGTTAFRVTAAGNVGVNVQNPATRLDVYSGSADSYAFQVTHGTTVKLRMGYIGGYGAIIDSKGSSAGMHILRLRSGQTTLGEGGTELFCANADGKIGIRRQPVSYDVEIAGNVQSYDGWIRLSQNYPLASFADGYAFDLIKINSSGQNELCYGSSSQGVKWTKIYGNGITFYNSSRSELGHFSNAGGFYASTGIYSDGYVSGGGLSTSSDQRLKANIKDFGYSKDLLMSVKPREWDWNELTPMKGHAAGFVAQEIEPLLPYAVTERTYKQLYYDMFHALEISGLQDHERRIAALENENRMLKEEIKRLRS